MNWLSPIEGVNYRRSTGNGLQPDEVDEIKTALRGLRSRTRKRAEIIRNLATKLGVGECAVRRAVSRNPRKPRTVWGRTGMPIVIDGVRYSSMRAAADDLECHRSAIARMLRDGEAKFE